MGCKHAAFASKARPPHAMAASSLAGNSVPAACAAECAAANGCEWGEALTDGATSSTNGCPASAAAVSSTRLGWMPFFFNPVYFLLRSQQRSTLSQIPFR